ncbi:MAG: hypothetical protein AAGA77_03705 [Bacteroidota bacterium]
MGYCGIKIPGHSGTDFKHKKVFKGSKKLLNEKQKFVDTRVESRDKRHWDSRIIILIKLTSALSILVLTALLFMFFMRSTTVSIHKSQLPSEYTQSIKDMEKERAGNVLYRSAQLHLEAGNLDYAQDEIILFLKLYPKSIEGLKLTHEILVQQCNVNKKYCHEAKVYEDYLKTVKKK